jgi:hypothetical protein
LQKTLTIRIRKIYTEYPTWIREEDIKAATKVEGTEPKSTQKKIRKKQSSNGQEEYSQRRHIRKKGRSKG